MLLFSKPAAHISRRSHKHLHTISLNIGLFTKRDALLHSAGANAQHGLCLTNEDKRRSVLVLLTDDVWKTWSDNTIAKHCHVSQPFVGKVRKEITPKLTVEAMIVIPKNDAEAITSIPYTRITVITPALKAAPVLEVENQNPVPDEKPAEPPAPPYGPKDDELTEAHNTVVTLSEKNIAQPSLVRPKVSLIDRVRCVIIGAQSGQ